MKAKEELVKYLVKEGKISEEKAEEALNTVIEAINNDLNQKGKEEVLKEVIDQQVQIGNFKKCEICHKLIKIEEYICDGCGNLI